MKTEAMHKLDKLRLMVSVVGVTSEYWVVSIEWNPNEGDVYFYNHTWWNN